MKSDYLSYHHYVCEVLEPLFSCVSDFTCKLQQPMRKCAIRVYMQVIRIGGRGWGWGRPESMWPLGIPDITIKTNEYAWKKLKYLSYITMYVKS